MLTPKCCNKLALHASVLVSVVCAVLLCTTVDTRALKRTWARRCKVRVVPVPRARLSPLHRAVCSRQRSLRMRAAASRKLAGTPWCQCTCRRRCSSWVGRRAISRRPHLRPLSALAAPLSLLPRPPMSPPPPPSRAPPLRVLNGSSCHAVHECVALSFRQRYRYCRTRHTDDSSSSLHTKYRRSRTPQSHLNTRDTTSWNFTELLYTVQYYHMLK